jgi:hypothetical protein
MATNKLMEAAADILTGSKAKAPAMPPQKLEGEVVDAGGPTPQNYKPDDDSAKIHTTKAVGDNSAHNQSTIKTKPSAASGKVVDSMKKEESETQEEIIAEEEVSFKEDIDALFADDSTISEEFKSKATTIFEARVHDRVSQIQEQMETEYASMLEEAVETIKEDLTTKVDDYLNYIVEQWLEQNEIAIESSLRAELTEEFIAGLRNLFAEHYIDVPTEKVDLVDELAGKVEELEGKLSEEIERAVEYKKALVEARKVEIARDVCGGLTETQVEKIKSLAESVEFSTEEEYKEKLETIRENYFPSGIKKADEQHLHEQVEDSAEQTKVVDPFVAAVTQAISKTKLQ